MLKIAQNVIKAIFSYFELLQNFIFMKNPINDGLKNFILIN